MYAIWTGERLGYVSTSDERLLAGLQLETCLVYLDDIIIFSMTFDDHLSKLQAVFQRLREANLHLKPQKCELQNQKFRTLVT